MSSRLKIIFIPLIAVTVLAIAITFLLISRRAPAVETPVALAPIEGGTLPQPDFLPTVDTQARDTKSKQDNEKAPLQQETTEAQRETKQTEGFFGSSSLVDIPIAATDEETRTSLIAASRLIAERFGTYSSQNRFRNLLDLEPFMTETLATWLDSYITDLKRKSSANTYTATATLALSAVVKELDTAAGYSTVQVKTSQTTTAGKQSKTASGDFEVKFLRSTEGWKIDNVRWLR